MEKNHLTWLEPAPLCRVCVLWAPLFPDLVGLVLHSGSSRNHFKCSPSHLSHRTHECLLGLLQPGLPGGKLMSMELLSLHIADSCLCLGPFHSSLLALPDSPLLTSLPLGGPPSRVAKRVDMLVTLPLVPPPQLQSCFPKDRMQPSQEILARIKFSIISSIACFPSCLCPSSSLSYLTPLSPFLSHLFPFFFLYFHSFLSFSLLSSLFTPSLFPFSPLFSLSLPSTLFPLFISLSVSPLSSRFLLPLYFFTPLSPLPIFYLKPQNAL